MARRSVVDRLERFLRRHEGNGGGAIIGLLVIMVIVGALAFMTLRS